MSNDHRDSNNPFAPPRKPQGESESDDYRFDYRPEDFDYDPEEILDDEEEPEFTTAWQDGDPSPPGGEAPPSSRPAATGRDDEPDDDESDLFDEPDEDDEGDEDTDDDPANESDFDPGEDEDYDDQGDWDDDEEDRDERQGVLQSWPLGMIAIAVVALILLAVGGFGVMQERSAMEEQIRDLQARLALAVTPEQVATEREAHGELVQSYDALQGEVQTLRLENRQLSDTVNGLEQQLEVQREAAAAAPKPAQTPKPAPKPAATPARGDWFVNFGSYSQRELAQSWAERLQPAAGEVVVTPVPDSELYRVRVISLPDKKTAQAVATSLQQQYDLSRLWVGEE